LFDRRVALVQPRSPIIAVLIGFCIAVTAMVAQHSGGTTLVLRVMPEEHLTPTQVALQFRVSEDGSADVASQTATIVAWVRALPGQRIRLVATPGTLYGPAGPVPPTVLRWNGSATQATAGGQEARCTSGSFQSAAEQDLAAGWDSSGTLTCGVVFSLANPQRLPPGVYSGVVSLALRTR
jgi:hypothetical protein